MKKYIILTITVLLLSNMFTFSTVIKSQGYYMIQLVAEDEIYPHVIGRG